MDEKNNCVVCKNFREECNKKFTKIPKYNKIVQGYGNYNSSILFIGEGPGPNGAARLGIPFTGDDSGVIVQKSLIELQLSKHNKNEVNPEFEPDESLLMCFITNVFRCYSYKIKKIKMDMPLFKSYQKHCLNHVKDEIDRITNLNKICIIGKDTVSYITIEYLNELKNSYDVFFVCHPSYFKKRMHLNEEVCVSKFIEQFNKHITDFTTRCN